MARKKDPAVGVLKYFRTAEVGQAVLVLGLAKDVVKERTGGGTISRVSRKTKGGGSPSPVPPVPGSSAA